jgi:hypothetical protein
MRSLFLAGAVSLSAVPASLAPAQQAPAAPISAKAVQAQAALRDLWVDHIFWVRNVVIETLAHNSSGAAGAEAQVVANAKQLAASIEPFYGKSASEKLFALLAAHYGAIKQYLDAGTNETAKNAAIAAATRNADEIAVFLAGANPNLPVDTLRAMLDAHVSQHFEEIDQLRAKQFQAESGTWEMMKGHVYMIADAMAEALAKQFPAKFT